MVKPKRLVKIFVAAVVLTILVVSIAPTVLVLESNRNHYLGIMKNLSKTETKAKLQSLFNGSKLNLTELITWEHERLEFTWDPDITRHEDPIEILEYGKGRCGEFAILYVSLCLAQDYQARLVVNMLGDHSWAEVKLDDRWVHVDPSEKKINDPYLYERDWGSWLIMVYAFSDEDVEDVTWNYKNIDPNAIKDFLWGVGTLIGIIGGLPQIVRFFKKKPRLSLRNIEIKRHPAIDNNYSEEPARLEINFHLWNGKGIIQKLRASDASFIRVETTIVSKSKVVNQKLGPSVKQTIPVGTYLPQRYVFNYDHEIDTVNIKVDCEEGSKLIRTVKTAAYIKV